MEGKYKTIAGDARKLHKGLKLLLFTALILLALVAYSFFTHGTRIQAITTATVPELEDSTTAADAMDADEYDVDITQTDSSSPSPSPSPSPQSTFWDAHKGDLVNSGNPPNITDCRPLFPKVIVYNRIPKAGSSTMLSVLRKLSAKNGFRIVRPDPKHDPDVARKAIREALVHQGRTVIVEHFHYPDIVSNRVAYMNVMRNPVERCVSMYYYSRLGPRDEAEKAYTIKKFGNLTMNECLGQPYEEFRKCFNCVSQGQARFFCGPEGGVCDKPHPEEMLYRAWSNMESQYFVGVTEDLSSTVDVLETLYPTFFKGMGEILASTPPQRVNNKPYELPSEESRKKIAEWTAVDAELYSKAAEKLKTLHRVCAARRDAAAQVQAGDEKVEGAATYKFNDDT